MEKKYKNRMIKMSNIEHVIIFICEAEKITFKFLVLERQKWLEQTFCFYCDFFSLWKLVSLMIFVFIKNDEIHVTLIISFTCPKLFWFLHNFTVQPSREMNTKNRKKKYWKQTKQNVKKNKMYVNRWNWYEYYQ